MAARDSLKKNFQNTGRLLTMLGITHYTPRVVRRGGVGFSPERRTEIGRSHFQQEVSMAKKAKKSRAKKKAPAKKKGAKKK